MKKVFQKWGDSIVLRFNSEEVRAYGIKVGYIADIEMQIIKPKVEYDSIMNPKEGKKKDGNR